MTERPGEPEPTHPFLAKPVSPSGETPPPPTAPLPPYGAYPPPPQPGGYQQYPPAPYLYPFQEAHSGANTAMGLGIASLACGVLTFVVCITLPGVLCGPFAIALAVRAQKQMREQPGRYSNEGAAMAGLITGILGTVVGLAVTALVVIYAGFIFTIFGLGTA